jgi:hypothetical protein
MLGMDGHTVAEAAQMALTPGGPSLDELEDRIRARRAELTVAVAS